MLAGVHVLGDVGTRREAQLLYFPVSLHVSSSEKHQFYCIRSVDWYIQATLPWSCVLRVSIDVRQMMRWCYKSYLTVFDKPISVKFHKVLKFNWPECGSIVKTNQFKKTAGEGRSNLFHCITPGNSLHKMGVIVGFSFWESYRSCWMHPSQTLNLDGFGWKGFHMLLDHLISTSVEAYWRLLAFSFATEWRAVYIYLVSCYYVST